MNPKVTPKRDYMIVLKHEKKTKLFIPKDAETIRSEMVPFEIVAIGPGVWEHSIFIKTTHKPGDMVFISGGVIETKFKDVPYFFAREKDVVAELAGGSDVK